MSEAQFKAIVLAAVQAFNSTLLAQKDRYVVDSIKVDTSWGCYVPTQAYDLKIKYEGVIEIPGQPSYYRRFTK